MSTRLQQKLFLSGQKPIIGRDYRPNPTLRAMPRHWTLEGTNEQKWRWWADGDFWVGAAMLVFGLWACVVIIQETFS